MIKTYFAIFSLSSDEISIKFPDLDGCFTDGRDFVEAYKNAQEAMSLYLEEYIEKKIELPKASTFEELKDIKEELVPINIYVPTENKKKRINVILDNGLLEKMNTIIKPYDRSQFISEAIKKQLGDYSSK